MKFTRRETGWQFTLALGFGWAISFGRYRGCHYFFDLMNRSRCHGPR